MPPPPPRLPADCGSILRYLGLLTVPGERNHQDVMKSRGRTGAGVDCDRLGEEDFSRISELQRHRQR